MILSFGWTTPALLAGAKNRTRRRWTPRHAAAIWKASEADNLFAWNAGPRVVQKNPHAIARLKLITPPFLSAQYPDDDYDAEGLRWLDDHGIWMPDPRSGAAKPIKPRAFWRYWQATAPTLYVVDFEVLEMLEPCYSCGRGREEGHEFVVDRWEAGEDWQHHVYDPALLVEALRRAGQ